MRESSWGHVARRATATALAVSLLLACSPTEQPRQRERASIPERAASTPPSAAPRTARAPEPKTALRSAPADTAAGLVRQLEQAAATVRDQSARGADVRRAAELDQLAVRILATSPPTFRRGVVAALRPETAEVVRGDLAAARSLMSITDPPETLPQWRIVAPPPAAELLSYYQRAQRRTGVHWSYLASIHLVETRMGRIRGTSTAGARGPMQFLPSTWQLYGGGGDITEPRDAILAAARLLKAHGAPGDMAGALYHYNPSGWYVRAVTAYARTMQRSGTAFRGYYHWRVLFRRTKGLYLLPVGYPKRPAVLLPGL